MVNQLNTEERNQLFEDLCLCLKKIKINNNLKEKDLKIDLKSFFEIKMFYEIKSKNIVEIIKNVRL